MTDKQEKAIKKLQENKEEILKMRPNTDDNSGIYVFHRDENGFKYAYVGQAKHLLSRLAGHLNGYPLWIDSSIKKHKLYSKDNRTGWKIFIKHCSVASLNETEKDLIAGFAQNGYQLRNKTAGGQDKGKFGIAENKPPKGYRDGLKQGKKNAQKEVAKLVTRLTIDYDKTKKLDERYYNKFQEFIKGE